MCRRGEGGENALITGAAPGGGKPRFVRGGGDPLKVLWNSNVKSSSVQKCGQLCHSGT